MSLKYHLVERRDLSANAAPGDMLLYGQVKSCDEVTFQMVCERIEHSTMATAGDVKMILSAMMDVLKEELRMGHVVQMGELGRFRMSVGCRGAKTEKEFNTSLFKKGKIIFTPSVTLKNQLGRPSFERLPESRVSGGQTAGQGQGTGQGQGQTGQGGGQSYE